MNRQKAFGVFSVVAAMMFTGCGPTGGGGGDDNNGGGGGGGGGGSLTQEQFTEKAASGSAKAFCRAVFECPEQAGELLVIAGRYPSQSVCEERLLEDLGANIFQEESDGVTAGRLEYDADKASTCIADVEALLAADACSVSLGESLSDACDEVFLGQVAEGGNCASSDECTDGLGCVFETNDCYGECKADLCNGAACADGEFCDFAAEGGEACAPKLKEGDTCSFSDDCTLEADDVECLASQDDPFAGTCTKYGTIAAGGFCDSDSDFCVDGLRCDFDTEVCVSSGSTGSIAQSGEVCDLENTPCAPGLVCTNLDFNTGAGTCGAPKGSGESCFIEFECEPSFTCVGVNFMMSPPEAGACGERLANGQSCEDDSDCQSRNCNDGTCGDEDVCVVP